MIAASRDMRARLRTRTLPQEVPRVSLRDLSNQPHDAWRSNFCDEPLEDGKLGPS